MTLLSVQAAQRRIAKNLRPVATEKLPLADALGRVLARDVGSVDLPLFDNSSVDGFAVLSSDLLSASRRSPRRLQVIADIPAGSHTPVRLRSGHAARIMTGAPIPRGADAVIMLEDTDHASRGTVMEAPLWVNAFQSVERGAHIRNRGIDVRRGHTVLHAGQRLRPQDLGLLAMLGRPSARVFRRPRIALLSTGNELVQPGHRLRPGGIHDTNSATLEGMIVQAGCEVIRLGVAPDRQGAIQRLLSRAIAEHVDLIVSSAGVSVGAFDLMRQVVQDGGRLRFWRVNVRPGKPLAVGDYQGVPFLGLPGNPVSAFVGFELFVRPALARLSGQKSISRKRLRVRLAQAVESDGRESYLRVLLQERGGEYVARLTGHQGSGNLVSLVEADALLMVPAGVKSLAVGDLAEAWPI